MASAMVLVAVGCMTGVLAGMLGAGGGFAAVALFLAAGADPQVAVGTAIVYLMVMGTWGTVVHLNLETVDLRLVGALGIAAAAAGVGGAELAERMDDEALVLGMGIFTGVVTAATLAWPPARRPLGVGPSLGARAGGGAGMEPPADEADEVGSEVDEETDGHTLGASAVVVSVAGGSALGLLKGLFGVGAGFLLVPVVVGVAHVPRRIVVGSSLFAVLVASVAAGVRHVTFANVGWRSLGWLVAGGLVGSFLGTRVARTMSAAALRRVFLAMMAVSTVYLLVLAPS